MNGLQIALIYDDLMKTKYKKNRIRNIKRQIKNESGNNSLVNG